MVTADGRVKLADFGIAKATGADEHADRDRHDLGTPHYMAPEQAMGQAVGPWTDLYSVGCMAYELVTGRLPFGDVEAPMAVLLRHINEAPVPACVVAPDVDPRLSDWISVLLAKDPAARPQSAAEAWDTLRGARARRRRPALAPHVRAAGATAPNRFRARTRRRRRARFPPDPVFETFHAPPPARPPVDPAPPRSATSRRARRSRAPPDRRASPGPRGPGESSGAGVPLEAVESSRAAIPLGRRGVAHRRVRHGLAWRAVAHERPHGAAPRRGREAGPATPRRRRRAALVAMPLAVVAVARCGLAAARRESAAAASAADPHGGRPVDADRRRQGPRRRSRPAGARSRCRSSCPGFLRARAAAPGGRESSGVVLVGMAPRSAHRPALLSPDARRGGRLACIRALGRLRRVSPRRPALGRSPAHCLCRADVGRRGDRRVPRARELRRLPADRRVARRARRERLPARPGPRVRGRGEPRAEAAGALARRLHGARRRPARPGGSPATSVPREPGSGGSPPVRPTRRSSRR